jgi:aminopeptidase N
MDEWKIDLVLDGEADALTLLSISLDGVDLVAGVDYVVEGDALTIPSSVLGGDDGGDGGAKKLATRVEIVPETNTQLSGLYKSGKMYCTQCEAMG